MTKLFFLFFYLKDFFFLPIFCVSSLWFRPLIHLQEKDYTLKWWFSAITTLTPVTSLWRGYQLLQMTAHTYIRYGYELFYYSWNSLRWRYLFTVSRSWSGIYTRGKKKQKITTTTTNTAAETEMSDSGLKSVWNENRWNRVICLRI